MKLINLFQFTIFFFFAISNLIAQSYMTLSDNPQVVGYTGAHLDLAIPPDPSPYNVLRFTLKGGDGGDRYVNYEFTTYRAKGGEGATAFCEFRVGNGAALEPGGTLRFIVGGKGQGTNGIGTEGCGGGGGTGLLYLAPGLNATSVDDWVILAVAGGGGGAFANGVGGTKNGKGGNDDPDGGGSNGHNSGGPVGEEHSLGGENGEGGLACDAGESGGAGGGGYLSNGQDILWSSAGNCNGTGGSKGGILGGDGGMDDSCVDGRDGGWGYGGGGSGEAAGGGGGGYSGGGGGDSGFAHISGGGGGGSYVEQALAESYLLTKGGTTSDPENGIIFYQFESAGPTISSCNDFLISLNASGQVSIDASSILDEYYAPDGSTITSTQSNFDCDDIGDNIVTVTITDTEGNTATCNSGIEIEDDTNPTASCKSVTLQLNTNGEGILTVNAVDNGSSDACGIDSKSINKTSFDCDDVGPNTVTLTVYDPTGHASTCSAMVTVQDQVNPIAYCQNITIQLNENGQATIDADDIDNGSSDACGLDSRSLSKTSFNCNNVGFNAVVLTVSDVNNNSDFCTASVIVEDHITPTANCQDVTIQLDANGQIATTADAIDDGSSDACGIQSLTISQSDFDCDEVGSNTVTLTTTDVNGNSNTCSATVTVQDQVIPVALCQNVTIQLDDSGQATTTANAIDNGSSDACGIQSLTITQSDFDCDDVGANTVTLTATDVNGNSNTCSATVTVQDQVIPVALCQNVTIQLDGNGQASTSASAIDDGSSDACGIQSLTITQSDFDCSEIGGNTVTMTVTDANGNSNTCSASVIVEDNIPPVAICQDITVDFNGEQSIGWTIGQLWDEAASSDNCEDVFAVSQSLSLATCDQLGSTLTVTLTIEDGSGNETSCDAYVTVDGLPCGWISYPEGINCADTEADYDPVGEQFSLTSAGCYDPSYYRSTDSHGFIQTELCGDGEIIAEVSEVVGSGWAGISMRESNDPNAKMLQLMIDGSLITRREFRASTGGLAFAHQFQTQGHNWLKLTRSGNQFSAYRSLDGTNWTAVFVTNLAMSNCIEVGLITMNGASNGEVTGLFENVSVSGAATNSLQGSDHQTIEPSDYLSIESSDHQNIKLYPNPASQKVNLQLEQFNGKEIQIRIYNHYGQTVLQQRQLEVSNPTQQLDISNLLAGTYIVEIMSGTERMSKKLVVMGL